MLEKIDIDGMGEAFETGDGSLTMKHPEHDELYHSHSGALFEAKTLYIEGSEFASRIKAGTPVHVLDVGLGLGYNAIATIDAWLDCDKPSDLSIFSLEYNPNLVAAIASGAAPWQKNWDEAWLAICASLQKKSDSQFDGEFTHGSGAKLAWVVNIGDAKGVELQCFGAKFDFVWQDPFSPSKNPSMWDKTWFKKVFECSRSGTSLMTYSVSRVVKDSLTDAGWAWKKISGSKGKKNWLKATKQ